VSELVLHVYLILHVLIHDFSFDSVTAFLIPLVAIRYFNIEILFSLWLWLGLVILLFLSIFYSDNFYIMVEL